MPRHDYQCEDCDHLERDVITRTMVDGFDWAFNMRPRVSLLGQPSNFQAVDAGFIQLPSRRRGIHDSQASRASIWFLFQ